MSNNLKFVQAQDFQLAGAGVITGATTIVLKTFKGIDGALLTMTDFGAIGFATIEPGNGVLEEQISFTGVTQNGNGTATLTGVKTVLFVSPYTATSGLAKTHAGSTTLIISNTSGFYDRLTARDDDETITGLWTFPSGANNPALSSYIAPTLDTQLATKKYVDDSVTAGAPDASTTTKGITKLDTAPASATNPIAVGSNSLLIVPTGTSGGIIGFTSTTARQSSVLLTLHALIIGGGAGATPTPLAGLGTTTTVLHGNAAGDPTFGAVVLTTDVSGILPVANGGTGASSLPFSGVFKNGAGEHTTGGGTFTIAHGLGATPKYFKINYFKGANGSQGEMSVGSGAYNGTTQSCAYRFYAQSGSNNNTGNSTTIGVLLVNSASTVTLSFSISWDATNITLTSNTDATFDYEWEAMT